MSKSNLNLKLEKQKNISENIYDVLSKAIIFGKFKAGQTINGSFIAKEFGVSRTPLREAFKRLEQEGWIESASNGRKTIKKTSLREAIEIYDIRSVLEPYLIELVCKKITDDELEKLEEIINEGISYLHSNKDNKTEKILDINKKFTMLLYKIAENKVLYNMLSFLYDNLLHYRISNLRNIAYEERSICEHKKIFEALKSRNIILARKITRKHIKIAKEMVIHSCDENSEKSS